MALHEEVREIDAAVLLHDHEIVLVNIVVLIAFLKIIDIYIVIIHVFGDVEVVDLLHVLL